MYCYSERLRTDHQVIEGNDGLYLLHIIHHQRCTMQGGVGSGPNTLPPLSKTLSVKQSSCQTNKT